MCNVIDTDLISFSAWGHRFLHTFCWRWFFCLLYLMFLEYLSNSIWRKLQHLWVFLWLCSIGLHVCLVLYYIIFITMAQDSSGFQWFHWEISYYSQFFKHVNCIFSLAAIYVVGIFFSNLLYLVSSVLFVSVQVCLSFFEKDIFLWSCWRTDLCK